MVFQKKICPGAGFSPSPPKEEKTSKPPTCLQPPCVTASGARLRGDGEAEPPRTRGVPWRGGGGAAAPLAPTLRGPQGCAPPRPPGTPQAPPAPSRWGGGGRAVAAHPRGGAGGGWRRSPAPWRGGGRRAGRQAGRQRQAGGSPRRLRPPPRDSAASRGRRLLLLPVVAVPVPVLVPLPGGVVRPPPRGL